MNRENDNLSSWRERERERERERKREREIEREMAGAFAYQHDVAYPEFDRWLMQMTTYLAFTHLIAGVGDLPKI